MTDNSQNLEITHTWLSMTAAIDMILRHNDIPKPHAKVMLISFLQSSQIQTSVKTLIQEADIEDWNIEGDEDEWDDWRLKRHPRQSDKCFIRRGPDGLLFPTGLSIFAESDGWAIDSNSIDWEQGIILARKPAAFHSALKMERKVTVPTTPPRSANPTPPQEEASIRRIAVELRLERAGVREIAGLSNEPRPQKNSGGKPRAEGWEEWIAELVAYVEDTGIRPDLEATPLMKAIEERFGQRETLDRTTVRRTVVKVLERVRTKS